MTNDMTLSERIQANTFLSHLSKKNSQVNLADSQKINTPPNKRKNSVKIESKEIEVHVKEGQSTASIAESPKFL